MNNRGLSPIVVSDAVKLVATSGGTTSEVVRYLHSDHLNTPRLATNSTAQVIWRWEGTAFGDSYPNEDVDGDGKLTTVNLRFAGQYYDAETGLHYNWNRYYDPRIGRYVTSDPVGLLGGLNTYAYVENNPLGNIDPLGLAAVYGSSSSLWMVVWSKLDRRAEWTLYATSRRVLQTGTNKIRQCMPKSRYLLFSVQNGLSV